VARRKTLSETVRGKPALPERLAALRSELFGERGGPEMARRLGVPVRTWYNYEHGVTIPADVLLNIIELTSVEPAWLLKGEGPKFRRARSKRPESGATREAVLESIPRSEAPRASTSRTRKGTQPTVVAEILSRASSLEAPEELQELTAGLLALRAKRLAPVVSGEETRLLLAINEGVPLELRDRVASLIEKRDDCSLTVAENSELMRLADEIERRGVERLEALSTLAELRGVSLRELMKSLGLSAGDHG
jgi:transcriptional regulator with XRE-family HTH domain